MARQVGVDLALDDRVGDVGRRRRGVEPVGGARAEVGLLDELLGTQVLVVLGDDVELVSGAELVAESDQRLRVLIVRRGGVLEV
jgi:hypothetical protein